ITLIAVSLADALTPHPEGTSVRRTRRDPQLDRSTVQCGHLDLSPKGGLLEGDRCRKGQVVGLAPEDRMRAHVHSDVEVAGGAAVFAGAAAALEADPLAVGNSRRNPNLHGLSRFAAARAV